MYPSSKQNHSVGGPTLYQVGIYMFEGLTTYKVIDPADQSCHVNTTCFLYLSVAAKPSYTLTLKRLRPLARPFMKGPLKNRHTQGASFILKFVSSPEGFSPWDEARGSIHNPWGQRVILRALNSVEMRRPASNHQRPIQFGSVRQQEKADLRRQ